MTRVIRRHPVAAFLVLTALVSYGVGIPTLLATGAFTASSHTPRAPTLTVTYLGRLPVVAGPALAALVVTWIVSGRRGVASLLAGLRPRAGVAVWGLGSTLLALAATALAYGLTGTPSTRLWAALERGWPLLLLHYALQVALIGAGEELGWRGWLLPALQREHGAVGATLRVAGCWYLWHLPALLQGAGFAASFALLTLALSALFTALWARTRRSVLAVAIAHGAVNAPQVFFETALGAPGASGTVGRAWYALCAIYGGLAALGTLALVPWWRGRLRRTGGVTPAGDPTAG